MSTTANRPARILPTIVLSQLAGTSLWFAGNAVLAGIKRDQFATIDLSQVTAAVQLGFITGSILLAASGLSDRFESRHLFCASALTGAALNVGAIWCPNITALLIVRFGVGCALAGIYPIGMKAAAGWFKSGLGNALGFLVGALVVGTALPHLVGESLPWRTTLVTVSIVAATGGVAMLALVPEGPFATRSFANLRDVVVILKSKRFNFAALGYIGHMWELYAFWAFVPRLIEARNVARPGAISFMVIAIGGLGCVLGGLATRRASSRCIAMVSLAISGICALLVPLTSSLPTWAFIAYLLVWGTAVVADSPQLSSMVANALSEKLKGTGLAWLTAVGFAIATISIVVFDDTSSITRSFQLLAIGPAIGWIATWHHGESAAAP